MDSHIHQLEMVLFLEICNFRVHIISWSMYGSLGYHYAVYLLVKCFYSSILYSTLIIQRQARYLIRNDTLTLKTKMLVERSLCDNTNRVAWGDWPPSASDVTRWHLLDLTSIFGSDLRLSTYSWKTSLWYSSDFIFNTVFHSCVEILCISHYCKTIWFFLVSWCQCTIRKCSVICFGDLFTYLVQFYHLYYLQKMQLTFIPTQDRCRRNPGNNDIVSVLHVIG